MRHLLGLSGGKDSAALALYMKDKVPNMEYYFCDTHVELPETYAYLKKLETKLGKKIKVLTSGGFDYWLSKKNGFLPSVRARWCTKKLKILPFQKYVGSDNVISYIGLRADENRANYIVTKPNIQTVYPFMTDGLEKKDILKIIEKNGIGMPDYYTWRSRSGCYFCFFQRKIEWVRLYEIHPDLFEKAIEYEKKPYKNAKIHTWSSKESLLELIARKEQIISNYEKKIKRKKLQNEQLDLFDEPNDDFCYICHL